MRRVRRRRLQRLGLSVIGAGLLAGCGGSSGLGTLSGHLYLAGGPAVGGAAPSPRPLAGRVVATGPSGSQTATAGPGGRYTMQLAAGTYTVTGISPADNEGDSACPANGKVTVVRGQERTDDVYCVVP